MIRELIDTELEAVAGGKIDLTFIDQDLKQTNKANQFAFSIGGAPGALPPARSAGNPPSPGAR